jgi:pimeloyl-ACP methyl ester carboxylesterase
MQAVYEEAVNEAFSKDPHLTDAEIRKRGTDVVRTKFPQFHVNDVTPPEMLHETTPPQLPSPAVERQAAPIDEDAIGIGLLCDGEGCGKDLSGDMMVWVGESGSDYCEACHKKGGVGAGSWSTAEQHLRDVAAAGDCEFTPEADLTPPPLPQQPSEPPPLPQQPSEWQHEWEAGEEGDNYDKLTLTMPTFAEKRRTALAQSTDKEEGIPNEQRRLLPKPVRIVGVLESVGKLKACSKFGIPLLAMRGEDDSVVPALQLELLERECPHAKVLRVAGIGHDELRTAPQYTVAMRAFTATCTVNARKLLQGAAARERELKQAAAAQLPDVSERAEPRSKNREARAALLKER